MMTGIDTKLKWKSSTL